MTPDRWNQISQLCHAALALDEQERRQFLVTVCEGDDGLRQEVESLLAASASAERFLDRPAIAGAQLANDSVTSAVIGRRLGVYEVQSLVGVGGMGEVYRAYDTKLGRAVAVKILPRAFTSDGDRLARFQREARVLASLNHPNIATIHGTEEADNVRALILEFVEGPTLASLIGTLKLEDALSIARQIADALDAAHEKGIVHRDLKPANVKITPGGLVKVLDFGLAKALVSERVGADLTETPTPSMGRTHEGMILGTPAYMSPEQARGHPLDKRTDIWAFGCVLYEMLTGQRAFGGTTISDSIAAVLEREPAWDALPKTVPPNVYRLLRRCLMKDSRRRLHDIADARIEIEETSGEVPERSSPVPARRPRWLWAGVGGAAAAGSLLTWLAVGRIPAVPSTATPAVHLTIPLLAGDVFPLESGFPVTMAISPNSDRIVFAARHNGVDRLYVRRLDEPEAHLLPGTEGSIGPFFSPDGQWLGFYSDRALKKLPVAGGGAPTVICPAANVTGASWGSDGRIIFSTWLSPLSVVSADGGTPEALLPLDKEAGEVAHDFPHVLPGGQAVLFAARNRIEVVDLSTKERRVVVEGSNPFYVNTGHLVFGRDRTVLAVPFDLGQRTAGGNPVVLLDDVSTTLGGASLKSQFAVALGGTLAFLPGTVEATGMPTSQRAAGMLWWLARDGRARQFGDDRRVFWHPRLSPDGSHLAVGVRRESGEEEVWIYDVARGTGTRRFEAPATRATWTSDGARLTFQRRGRLFTASALGRDEPTLTLEVPGSVLFPLDWSLAGDRLSYSAVRSESNRNIWLLSHDGKTSPFVATPSDERSASFSPDGAGSSTP